MEKLCVFCEHITMDTTGCYGDYPDPATFECMKNHWSGIKEYEFPEGFRKQILVAETCKDYSPPKGDT
jgi:hypothetical protein